MTEDDAKELFTRIGQDSAQWRARAQQQRHSAGFLFGSFLRVVQATQDGVGTCSG